MSQDVLKDKNKKTNDNRRREERVSGDGARFVLRHGKDALMCSVVNLSRLGLGVDLPETSDTTEYEPFQSGTRVSGVLHMGKKSLDAKAVVRVRRGLFLGLEYEIETTEFMKDLRAMLSPKYIAASIYQITPDVLSQDITQAFRGDEFECLLFKSGIGSAKESVQFFAGGRFVEVVDGVARFVPAPLIRTTGGGSSLDFVLEFASLDDSNDKKELRKFFVMLESIVNSWKEVPDFITKIVNSQLEILK